MRSLTSYSLGENPTKESFCSESSWKKCRAMVRFSCLGTLARLSKTGSMESTGPRAQACWQAQVLADHLLGVALSVVAAGAGASFVANASMAARKRVSMAGDGVAAALV
jgi:hypothetical protein